MNEVKNSVPAGVHPSYQIRPRHGALWGNTGSERAERSRLGQRRKVRHLALCHVLFQELRVHPINPQNDEFLIALPGARVVTRDRCRGKGNNKRQPDFPDECLQG